MGYLRGYFVLALLLPFAFCDYVEYSPLTNGNPMSAARHFKEKLLKTNEFAEGFDLPGLESYKKKLLGGEIQEYVKSTNENGTECSKSIEQLLVDLLSRKPYALQMVDAWGKPPSGIETGNMQWMGRYYECQKVRAEEFGGQWCSLMLSTPLSEYFVPTVTFSIASCVPDTCSQDEVYVLFKPFFNKSKNTFSASCPEQPTAYTTLDIVTLTILSILGIFMLVGTVYDIYTTMIKKQRYERILYDTEDVPSMDENQPSVFSEVVLSFSVIKNTKFVLDTTQKEGNINVLHGLRFISMTWVMLGHTYFFCVSYIDNPLDFVRYFISSGSFQGIANATFSVDTFFFLSGLLAAYLGLREMNRSNGSMSVATAYLYRYLRLTPVYALCILVSSSIFSKMGDGPIWPQVPVALRSTCEKYWWTNLLYINNIYPPVFTQECFAHGWYLANDMQFFLLAPFILMLLYRKPKIGIAALISGLLSSIFITLALSLHYKEQPQVIGMAQLIKLVLGGYGLGYTSDHVDTVGNVTTQSPPVGTSEADKYGNDLYAKPWCRMGVYFIGMVTGYILYNTRSRVRMNKILALIIWIVAIVTGLALVYGLWSSVENMEPLPNGVASFYNAVARPVWGLCLAWIVVASVGGYGGPIDKFLSWKAFIPLSRLTYCAYLVHPEVMAWYFGTLETKIHFSTTQMAMLFVGFMSVSYAVAYVVSMTLEMPVMGIIKIFLKNRNKNEAFRPTHTINHTDGETEA